VPFGGRTDPRAHLRRIPLGGGLVRRPRVSRCRSHGSTPDLLIFFAFGGMTGDRRDAGRLVVGQQVLAARRLRAGSQMISYELVMGLTVLGLVLIYGTADLVDIVHQQSGVLLGFLPAWGIFLQPFAAVLFITAAMAENRRTPFDLPEAESEIIAGYFTEYSAMKMGLFMFAEFIEIAVISALFSTLFLGGCNLPYMGNHGFTFPTGHIVNLPHGLVVLLQMGVFLVKMLLVSSFQILVRWSLPRFRYDQLLRFAWKFLLPICIANLAVTAVAVWALQGGRPVSKHTYKRREYWNKPEMGRWERMYIFEIVRGLWITGGVFTRNMWKWITGRKGALTSYYPEKRALTTRRTTAESTFSPSDLTEAPSASPATCARRSAPRRSSRSRRASNPNDPVHPKFPVRFEIDYSAASSAASASRPARRTPSAWSRRSPTCLPTTATACG
jgi:hypothetical protein